MTDNLHNNLPLLTLILLFSTALLLGALGGWLSGRRQGRRQLNEIGRQLDRSNAQLEAERNATREKIEFLKENQQLSEKNFQAISAQALSSNNRSFLDLAKTTLENYQQQAKGDLGMRHAAIEQLVRPLQDSLLKVDSKIEALEKSRTDAYARLDEQLKSLVSSQGKLEQETGNLVRALRNPSVRGRWGEIQLRKVVEMAGMVSYCDFIEQETADSGRLRPDMVIKLPNGRNIVVDSKAPLQAYLDSLETADEHQCELHLKQHARQVRDHLKKLAAKSYWEQFQPTPEFVVLFLPGEPFFSAALSQDPQLIEAGVDQKILLATPTTLIALLRSVAYGWRQEQLTENAMAISQLGQELHDRLATLSGHFAQLGKGLDRAVESYNRAMASFDSRVLVSARKFKELGAGNSKDLEEVQQLERQPRILPESELGTDSH
jgi:DNA recombination protein RmuC